MQVDSRPGNLGRRHRLVTRSNFTATVPSQATPDSIASVANSFVGQAWNMDGCWVLTSTIAAEAGTSLPVQSTLIGLPGQSNGEWIVAFNGPTGQSGNWQSMVTAGEIVVIGTPGGGGHITTCVAGTGSSAMLVGQHHLRERQRSDCERCERRIQQRHHRRRTACRLAGMGRCAGVLVGHL